MYFPGWACGADPPADAFIPLMTNVQFSKGSVHNRVQVKSAGGMSWMTVRFAIIASARPSKRRLPDDEAWRGRHLAWLEQSFDGCPHAPNALDLAASVKLAVTKDTAGRPGAEQQGGGGGGGGGGLAGPVPLFRADDINPVFRRPEISTCAGSGSARVLGLVKRRVGCAPTTIYRARCQELPRSPDIRSGRHLAFVQWTTNEHPYPQIAWRI